MSDDYDFKVMVSNQCPHCAAAKEIYKEKIDSGKLELIDADSELGRELINKLGIKYVPTVIRKDKITQEIKLCELSNKEQKVVCPDKVIEL